MNLTEGTKVTYKIGKRSTTFVPAGFSFASFKSTISNEALTPFFSPSN